MHSHLDRLGRTIALFSAAAVRGAVPDPSGVEARLPGLDADLSSLRAGLAVSDEKVELKSKLKKREAFQRDCEKPEIEERILLLEADVAALRVECAILVEKFDFV